MKKIFLTLILAVSIGTIASAQDYKTGIGLRGGTSWGLTLKHFVSQKAAFEGILYGYDNGFHVAGLYEIHNTAFEVDHLKWYYGAGAHLGTWNNANLDSFVLGVDGILGIEYSFSEAPICIGLDWNPYFNIVGDFNFYPGSGALSIRYIF